jgi:hypothetical protein
MDSTNYDFVKRTAARLSGTKQALIQIDADQYKFTIGLKSIIVTPTQFEDLYFFLLNNLKF